MKRNDEPKIVKIWMSKKIFWLLMTLVIIIIMMRIYGKAHAQVITVSNGSIVTVYVDKTYGATIELPSAVHVVTPPKYIKVEPLTDPITSINQSSTPNMTTANDVKIFQVYPAKNKNIIDKMNFLLWNGKNISVQFVQSDSLQDNFYQLKFSGKSENNQSRFASNSKFFLSDEKNLIVKMLKDDGGTDRKIVNAKVTIDKYPDLRVKLVRIFSQDSLTGYVFTVTNTSSKTITLNPTVLTIGAPNRIEMIQTDHEELQSCKENNDPNPRGTGCMTALRIVTRDAKDLDSVTNLGTNSKAPFTTVPASINRGQM